MTLDEFCFEHEGCKFSGLTNHNKGKPILVCLHGYLDNAASFIPAAPYLDDYHIVAVDLCGHGQSFHRAHAHSYHLTDYAFDIVLFIKAYLREMKQGKVILVGHSLGAIVGSIVSASYPELLSAFVSIEACGPLSEDESTSANQIRSSFDSRFNVLRTADRIDPRDFSDLIKARCKINDLDANHAEMIMHRNCEGTTEGIKWFSDRALRTQSAIRMTEKQAKNILASISVPMLLILGDEGFEKVKRNLANRVDVMDALVDVKESQGGHYVHMQQPKEVAQHICDFVLKTGGEQFSPHT